jgi:hypothetical protein
MGEQTRKRAAKGRPKSIRTQNAGTLEFVNELLVKMKEQMKSAEYKVSLSDFVRLLQLQKELQEETVEEIKVKWVESREEE